MSTTYSNYIATRTSDNTNTGEYGWYQTNQYYPTFITYPNVFRARCRRCGRDDGDTKLLSNGLCERCDSVENGIPYEKLKELMDRVFIPFQSEVE